jgi:glycosyltransferase involved in cell wall biosynthesis
VNHLAFVIPTLDRIGGAERQVILLAKGLSHRGWRVSVLALSGDGGDAAAGLIDSGIAFLPLEMRKGLADPRGWFHFNRWLRQESPDLLHAHLPHAVWLARWSRFAAPVRVVVDSLHTSSVGTLGRRLGYRLSDWLTDEVTAVSHAVAEAYLSAAMARSITVLPNGIDFDDWRPDPTARTALRNEIGLKDEFLWLAAGRLDPVKDYPSLLSAMVEVPEPARLVIAGNGYLESELRRLCKELGLETRVRFLGFEPDVCRWMQAADGFVLSSRWEGLPMALLEAAACALPAVATDVSGTREVIVHGETGSLAVAGSAIALQGAMTRMMRTPADARFAMGRRARQHVIEHFSLKAVLDRWEALYTQLLKRNPTPMRRGRSSPPIKS